MIKWYEYIKYLLIYKYWKIIQYRKKCKNFKRKKYVQVISRCRYTGSALPFFQISTHYIRCLLIIFDDFITLCKYFGAGQFKFQKRKIKKIGYSCLSLRLGNNLTLSLLFLAGFVFLTESCHCIFLFWFFIIDFIWPYNLDLNLYSNSNRFSLSELILSCVKQKSLYSKKIIQNVCQNLDTPICTHKLRKHDECFTVSGSHKNAYRKGFGF